MNFYSVQTTPYSRGHRLHGKGIGVRSRTLVWRAFIRTTDSKHQLPIYPNLIKNRKVRALNEVWVADITYIRIRSSFVYLAAILDLYSRRIVGWAISKRIDSALCVARSSHGSRLSAAWSRLHSPLRPRQPVRFGRLCRPTR